VRDEDVEIPAGRIRLGGHLTIPALPAGIVVFAHGSGSSRHSPRNRYVSGVLNQSGLTTLLFDLLTMGEEANRDNVFDIALLGTRLLEVTSWLRTRTALSRLPVGYFGASTGAGAALWAAAEQGNDIAAVVSRGGRPDLAGPRLRDVGAPTLLIVGSQDHQVLELNRKALAQLGGEHRLEVVEGASHLFVEQGALETVADKASEWFQRHLGATMPPYPTGQ
jgi:putative phosphoribosyl transferase